MKDLKHIVTEKREFQQSTKSKPKVALKKLESLGVQMIPKNYKQNHFSGFLARISDFRHKIFGETVETAFYVC